MSKMMYRRVMTTVLITGAFAGFVAVGISATLAAPYTAYLLWSGSIIAANLATPEGGFNAK